MQLLIISPDSDLFSGEVEKITVPTLGGVFTILPKHIDMLAVLKKGEVSFLPNYVEHSSLNAFADHHQYIQIEGGMCKVVNDQIVLTLSTLE